MDKLFWCVISGVVALSWQVHTGNLELGAHVDTILPTNETVRAQ